ncbi:hypothetical protein U9R90_09405 [Streptomyces sp. E11-3]|uniref:hypothetical protein n=1 Tax=Streptomyces sp. E11-3 TaxID=3110112 RepID=UPI003980350F
MSSESAELRMQLAQLDGGGGSGGGEPTLASSATDKKRAATYMDEHLMRNTQAAGRMAEGGGTMLPLLVGPPAPGLGVLKPDTGLKGLSGWAADMGLSTAMTIWQGQVNRLMSQLNRELSGLRGANNVFQGQDNHTWTQLHSVQVEQPPFRSPFDSY